MKLRKFIATTIHEYLNEQQKIINENWYHGTPDAREIEKEGGFTHKTMTVDYVIDPNGFKELQINMKNARETGDMNLYFELLDKVDDFKEYFTYKKPLFLSDKYSVAKTYADPKRSSDYQNAVEKTYEVDVNCNKTVKIVATGDRFRYISIDKVKQGFINSGISEEEIDKLILMFNYYISDNKGIKTDVIAAIGNWLDFDCIDVVGVLDSYHGGTVKSIVRMVLDPTNVKIKRA
jgi:hypothetical protein